MQTGAVSRSYDFLKLLRREQNCGAAEAQNANLQLKPCQNLTDYELKE